MESFLYLFWNKQGDWKPASPGKPGDGRGEAHHFDVIFREALHRTYRDWWTIFSAGRRGR